MYTAGSPRTAQITTLAGIDNSNELWSAIVSRVKLTKRAKNEDKEHDLVDHKGMGAEPTGDGPEAKFTAPCEPHVNLMDDWNGGGENSARMVAVLPRASIRCHSCCLRNTALRP